MLTFIAYIFKIVISLFLGFIIGHDFKSNKENDKIVLYTSVLSFIVTVVICVVDNYYEQSTAFVIGFILLSLFILIKDFISDFKHNDKIKLIFSSLNGLVIGLGYILYSFLATIVFVYIVYNVNIFINLLIRNNSDKNINLKDEDKK